MRSLTKKFVNFLKREDGPTAVEYVLSVQLLPASEIGSSISAFESDCLQRFTLNEIDAALRIRELTHLPNRSSWLYFPFNRYHPSYSPISRVRYSSLDLFSLQNPRFN
jgi:hypothetical protein